MGSDSHCVILVVLLSSHICKVLPGVLSDSAWDDGKENIQTDDEIDRVSALYTHNCRSGKCVAHCLSELYLNEQCCPGDYKSIPWHGCAGLLVWHSKSTVLCSLPARICSVFLHFWPKTSGKKPHALIKMDAKRQQVHNRLTTVLSWLGPCHGLSKLRCTPCCQINPRLRRWWAAHAVRNPYRRLDAS